MVSVTALAEPAPSEPTNVYIFKDLDKKPEVIKRVHPKYPRKLKLNRTQGKVLAELFIDESGKVIKLKIVESSHPEFGASVLEAFVNWEFKPGIKDGVPVKTRFQLPAHFTLRR